MRRNIISIVRGGPAPEEQLSVLIKRGWDGGFFTWTGQKTDHVFAPKIQAAGLALQSVHAPYDRATRGGSHLSHSKNGGAQNRSAAFGGR